MLPSIAASRVATETTTGRAGGIVDPTIPQAEPNPVLAAKSLDDRHTFPRLTSWPLLPATGLRKPVQYLVDQGETLLDLTHTIQTRALTSPSFRTGTSKRSLSYGDRQCFLRASKDRRRRGPM